MHAGYVKGGVSRVAAEKVNVFKGFWALDRYTPRGIQVLAFLLDRALSIEFSIEFLATLKNSSVFKAFSTSAKNPYKQREKYSPVSIHNSVEYNELTECNRLSTRETCTG